MLLLPWIRRQRKDNTERTRQSRSKSGLLPLSKDVTQTRWGWNKPRALCEKKGRAGRSVSFALVFPYRLSNKMSASLFTLLRPLRPNKVHRWAEQCSHTFIVTNEINNLMINLSLISLGKITSCLCVLCYYLIIARHKSIPCKKNLSLDIHTSLKSNP